MNSREVVKRNLEFSGPERIGLVFDRGRANDFCGADLDFSKIWKQRRWAKGDVEYSDDVWGNIWHRIKGMGGGGEIYKPSIEDWLMLRNYELPDIGNPSLFKEAREVFSNDENHYHLAHLPGFPFAICRYLRKMEVYFQDLVLEREHIDELHNRVTLALEKAIKGFADAGVDGVIFCEDWGTQERLLINPEMWREIFKPLYVRLCSVAHKVGLHVLMHSCGYNWEILDDLAEVGINCFQFDQPALYGLERLSKKLQYLKVCLFSPVDIQRVLPTGNRKLITNEARKMVKFFGKKHGGFIAKSYGDLKGIGVRPEWAQWAYESFLEVKQLC